MPIYARFMKHILSEKKRLEEFQTVALNEESRAILLRKLPPKVMDPVGFIIPSFVGSNFQAMPFVILVLASTSCHCPLIRSWD